MTSDYSAERIHVSMRPRLAFVLLKYLDPEMAIRTLIGLDSGQPNGKAALFLKRVQPINGIRILFRNEFKAILERHDNRRIHP